MERNFAVLYSVLILMSSVLPVKISSVSNYFQDEIEMHPVVPRTERRHHIEKSEKDGNYWINIAETTLTKRLNELPNTNVAENVILFLGDGMGLSTVTAARIYQGQLKGQSGEENELAFDKFPYTGLAKTYCVDKQVPDSACSATAFLSGVKANYGTLGVTAAVPLNDCEASLELKHRVSSLITMAQAAGKSTGIVTTSRITHATPAGAYAHVANRKWESDADVAHYGQDPVRCNDIAEQLIFNNPGNHLKVILGGGRQKLLPQRVVDVDGFRGERLDGKNLIKAWIMEKKKRGVSFKYVTDRNNLLSTDFSRIDYLLGLFAPSHMPYHLEADRGFTPSLADMVEAAIRVLSKNQHGFFLLVEGARIDHGHHGNNAVRALDETVQFSKAIKRAQELTSAEHTLLLVTADHSHGMTQSGYPKRGRDIAGLNDGLDRNGHPYSILSYANGPGYRSSSLDGSSYDPSEDNTGDLSHRSPATVPISTATHSGEDVPVYAKGPYAHLFTGVYEQNYIPQGLAFASCIGKWKVACHKEPNSR